MSKNVGHRKIIVSNENLDAFLRSFILAYNETAGQTKKYSHINKSLQSYNLTETSLKMMMRNVLRRPSCPAFYKEWIRRGKPVISPAELTMLPKTIAPVPVPVPATPTPISVPVGFNRNMEIVAKAAETHRVVIEKIKTVKTLCQDLVNLGAVSSDEAVKIVFTYIGNL